MILLLNACKQKEQLFTLLSPDETGIHFVNSVQDSDSLDILDYLYFYNGGGVALGDINNDGLIDIFLTSNLLGNRLYLNKGSFKFEDITNKAGVKGNAFWNTGATMADVNGDGWLDIYVCTVGGYKNFNSVNELFINNGPAGSPGTFTEEAAKYGLDIVGFNTQAAFFDYDHDADIDMFLLQHSVHSNYTYGDTSLRRNYSEVSGGKLFRNDNGHFMDVTKEAGILASPLGYGLGVAVGDLNNDGWSDIYVSNDFHENDYYYLNNRNGTFTEMNKEAFGHDSHASMGNDIADYNNDGWLDVITLDMLPENEKILKSSFNDDPLDIYKYKKSLGYNDQSSRNCLQLNTYGGMHFSDIGLMTGMAATDWSWAPLMADYDLDGIKDLFISNGILRRPNDIDYANYIANDSIKRSLQSTHILDKRVIELMPSGKVHNYLFKGSDSLYFTDISREAGMNDPTLSNGAAYADLDNDGDLDLVVNNLNAPAGIYKNNTRNPENEKSKKANHFLKVICHSTSENTFGIGAKVILKNDGKLQYDYVMPTRGFESSISYPLVFGLGKQKVIDTLLIVWPDQGSQLLTNVKADQTLYLKEQKAKDSLNILPKAVSGKDKILEDVTGKIAIAYKHKENDFIDFNRQWLIPHKVSTMGPKIAVADVNKDGLSDFYICGAKYQPGKLFIQQKDGHFMPDDQNVFQLDSLCEDVDALFFDANGDSWPDLYVVSGGNEFWGNAQALGDRLYINDGSGHFSKSKGLPKFFGNKSCVSAADIDGDGDQDLFVGGSTNSQHYGDIPDSYLLVNDGKGHFTIQTDQLAPRLKNAGMVTDAVWTDFNNDSKPDLVVVGEWMPVMFFKNTGEGHLSNVTKDMNMEYTNGWWRCIKAADINGDGKMDLLVGNYGVNSKLTPSGKYPLILYITDVDENGSPDQILASAKQGKYYTFLGKMYLEKQLPAYFHKKYPSYHAFAGQTVKQIFGSRLKDAKQYNAYTFQSLLLLNNGKGDFIKKTLPFEAQVAPVEAFAVGDYDHDGKQDVLTGGNFYGTLPYEGRYDANDGIVLFGDGEGNFKTEWPWQTGFYLKGEVRDIKTIETTNGSLILIARNNDSLQVFRNR